MGNRHHLHVCRHCGAVMATSSGTPPRRCGTCGDRNFSPFAVA